MDSVKRQIGRLKLGIVNFSSANKERSKFVQTNNKFYEEK